MSRDGPRAVAALRLAEQLTLERKRLEQIIGCLLAHGSGRMYLGSDDLIRAGQIVIEPDDEDGILIRLVDTPASRD